MKLALLVVKDQAAEVFGVPQFAPTVAYAVRGFSDEVNRNEPQNLWFRHPEQFDLYELGEYDDIGAFYLLPEPRCCCRGRDVARQNAPGFELPGNGARQFLRE